MKIVAVAAGVVLLAAGCGGSGGTSGQQSAAGFVKQVTVQFSRGQSGRLWDELLPADQAIVSRARFVACQQNEGWSLKSIKVLETYNDPVDVEGKALPAKAVTVRVTSDGVTTATMHAVSVNGTWRWILQPVDRAAYRSGKCPRTG
ncbi:MAG: hypothetical protein ACXVZ2_04280 [Gaiellaceae bacterium]